MFNLNYFIDGFYNPKYFLKYKPIIPIHGYVKNIEDQELNNKLKIGRLIGNDTYLPGITTNNQIINSGITQISSFKRYKTIALNAYVSTSTSNNEIPSNYKAPVNLPIITPNLIQRNRKNFKMSKIGSDFLPAITTNNNNLS